MLLKVGVLLEEGGCNQTNDKRRWRLRDERLRAESALLN